MPNATSILAASLSLLLISPANEASAPSSADADVVGTRVVDLDGQVRRLGMDETLRPVALVFLGTQCPVSKQYVARMNELASEAVDAGAEFLGVISDPGVSAAEARAFREELGATFPIVYDASGDLADRLMPTHVPEAFVLSSSDRVTYRGRIDDGFENDGSRRDTVSSHDLLDAVRAVVKGGDVESVRTKPVGCTFDVWENADPIESVSYNRDIAPILNANCVECHREGDVGPFALEDYEDARRRARMIASVTKERYMPPWFAEPDAGHFRDERKLSRKQVALLQAWAEAGAPEGEADEALDAPELPTERWRLGEPDLLVEMPVDFEVPASGDDIYRYFVIPSELVEDKAIVAIDFRPGDPTVVHHCIAYMDRTGVAARIDALSERPGFSVFGELADSNGERFEPNGLDTTVQIAGWAPGTQPYVLPEGLGSPLAAGGDFVLEIHYHLTGKATTDRSALALYFADEPVERYTAGLVIGTQNIDIAEGEAEYWRHVWMDVPADMDLIDVSPHMHYLGKSVDVVATLPDGSEEPLIRIDDWDFRWQGAYFYREPVFLPEGSRIDAYFRFDNSNDNPFNPSNPPIRVREGWRTTDEMCLFYFTAVPRDPGETENIYRSMFQSFVRSGAPE